MKIVLTLAAIMAAAACLAACGAGAKGFSFGPEYGGNEACHPDYHGPYQCGAGS